MKIEMVMIRDADGNELTLVDTYGDAVKYCNAHNITGANGEYIAFGLFDTESRYFECTDYSEI